MDWRTGELIERDEITELQKQSGDFIPVPRYLQDEAGRLIKMRQPVDIKHGKSPLAKWARRKKHAKGKFKRRMQNKSAKQARRKNR